MAVPYGDMSSDSISVSLCVSISSGEVAERSVLQYKMAISIIKRMKNKFLSIIPRIDKNENK
jgi:hypothetical protein